MAAFRFLPSGRIFRPGIMAKLFLAILAVCSIMVLGMSVATRLSFQSGFLEYLSEIEEERITILVSDLADEYRQAGSWKSLREGRNWRRLISRFPRKNADQPEQQAALPETPPAKKKKGKKEPPAPRVSAEEQARHAWESVHLRSVLGLLDMDRQTLLAGVRPGPDAKWLPVVVDAVTVGWLTCEPLKGIYEGIDIRFQERQRSAVILIAVLGLILAALAAMLMARGLIAPLRRLTDTTGRLAAGDFTARVAAPARRSPHVFLKSLFFGVLSSGEGGRIPRNSGASVSGARDKENRRREPMAVRRRTPDSRWEGDELTVLANQLNHLAGVLESNEKARRNFMAEVAHDLRTPLAILRGEIEALEDGIRQVTPDSLASLRAEVELLGRLVDDIHTLSLADVGMLSFSKSRFDLTTCLAAALYACKERILARGLILDAELPEEPVPVAADSARLGQVFRNILENSLRYTDEGGTIQVRCHNDGNNVFVDVLDSPPAVPEEQLAYLFERFHTGDTARNRGSSGCGLGLAICRTLLEAQGGNIRALPSPIGGLWIRVQMPLAEK